MGNAFDRLIDAGGTAMFSETTEIIGAEKLVAARAVNDTVAGKILTAARRWEEKALSTGEDIRYRRISRRVYRPLKKNRSARSPNPVIARFRMYSPTVKPRRVMGSTSWTPG